MKEVAVLCCSRNSVYKTLPGTDCFDVSRDARTFGGGKPVLAHPPCRLWSAYCAHQAKSDNPEEEKRLGLFCVAMVRRWGGVIEQPAHSRLWQAGMMPRPGLTVNVNLDGFSIEVSQFWFGDNREKATWLWFNGIDPTDLPSMPFRLKPDGGDRRIWQLMSSRNEREKTPKPMAEWLLSVARLTTIARAPIAPEP